MKIGIDARSLEGKKTGVGRYLENLLKFWCYEKDCSFFLFFKQEIPQEKFLKTDNFQLVLLKTKSNFLFTHKILPHLIKKYHCDIFFSPGYILPLFIYTPAVLTLHDIIYEARPDLYNWPSKADLFNLKLVSKLSARKAKIIFTPSKFTKEEICKFYKIDPQKIIVTPLAADECFFIDKISCQLSEKKILLKLNLPKNYLFFAGACLERRHIKEIIFAVVKLIKRGYNIGFLISGPDLTEKKDIASIASNINKAFNKKVIFYEPYIDSKILTFLYHQAQALIYLSDYEGFGLPIIEAMASSCPVITGPAQALKETAGDSALIVENISENEIYDKIKLILDNKDLREDLKKRGLKRVKEFSWQKTAEITIAKIKEIKT